MNSATFTYQPRKALEEILHEISALAKDYVLSSSDLTSCLRDIPQPWTLPTLTNLLLLSKEAGEAVLSVLLPQVLTNLGHDGIARTHDSKTLEAFVNACLDSHALYGLSAILFRKKLAGYNLRALGENGAAIERAIAQGFFQRSMARTSNKGGGSSN